MYKVKMFHRLRKQNEAPQIPLRPAGKPEIICFSRRIEKNVWLFQCDAKLYNRYMRRLFFLAVDLLKRKNSDLWWCSMLQEIKRKVGKMLMTCSKLTVEGIGR